MASRLTAPMLTELSDTVQSFVNTAAPTEIGRLIASLREATEPAFSPEQLDAAAAAAAALDRSREERPSWPTLGERGLFFVFEGLDRSGKSTQSKLLAKHLEETGSVKWMCFPNRDTATGTLIDLYLRKQIELPDETVHLLFSANRWEASSAMVEELGRGTNLVCDRCDRPCATVPDGPAPDTAPAPSRRYSSAGTPSPVLLTRLPRVLILNGARCVHAREEPLTAA